MAGQSLSWNRKVILWKLNKNPPPTQSCLLCLGNNILKNVSTMEKSWQGAHLSTGASREAPVDNESFSTILKKSTPGISGSCFLTLGAMARSTRVNNASREALVDNRCFSTILTTSNPGIPGLCIHTLGAIARSTLVNRCLARGTCGHCLVFNFLATGNPGA